MPETDDALKRRLQAYFADVESEPAPTGIERLRMPADAPELSWRDRFLIPIVGVGVAAVVLLVVVLVLLPGRRNQTVDTGESAPSPTRRTDSTPTTGGTTLATPSTIATSTTTPRPTSTTAPPPLPTTTAPSTTAPTTTIPSGQLFADDFAGAQVGAVPLGWTVDSGTWAVVQSGPGKALRGSTPKGQEGRISNGSGWSDAKVSATVRRDAANTVGGVAARYQNASNYYFCKIDGSQIAVGTFIGNKPAILNSSKVSIPQNQTVTVALTVKGPSLQCSVNGSNPVTANDGTLTTGRMALLQDGPATFGTVVVTSA